MHDRLSGNLPASQLESPWILQELDFRFSADATL